MRAGAPRAVEFDLDGVRVDPERSALAGRSPIAIPNPHFPPGDEALALATVTLDGLTVEAVHRLGA